MKRPLTARQWEMLEMANTRSLPGDGYRIRGPGHHATAEALERRGLVRLGAGHVHITEIGREVVKSR